MGDETVWDDAAREQIREGMRRRILGELRLAKNDYESILQTCRDVYLDGTCPDNEWDSFVQFSADELHSAAARLAAEQEAWPPETDCDRLDRVETALRERGIVFWQASPCCDTCTYSEISDRIAVVDERHPGFEHRLRGYAFFIDQNLPEMLSKGTQLTVYLAYGWFSPDGSQVEKKACQKNPLGIGREICECLHAEGPDFPDARNSIENYSDRAAGDNSARNRGNPNRTYQVLGLD